MAATEQDFYAELIDAIQDVSGRHEGRRAVHAKGTLCAGSFTAAPGAKELSAAAHLQGEEMRAHVRVSNGTGDPDASDAAQDGRGLAVKLYLPDGTTTDMVMVSRRQFFVRTPADFLAFMRARKPDPETGAPDMAKLGEFLGAHPEAGPAVAEQLAVKPPVSYGTVEYNSLHAFKLIAPDGSERWVRFRFTPDAGEATHSDEEAEGLGPDYLQEEIVDRLNEGPVTFTLSAAIAQEGDPLDDPTAAWPEERERVELGTLQVSAPASDRDTGDDVLVFDPTRVTAGTELSDDPILHVRSHAYAESVYRRSGVRR